MSEVFTVLLRELFPRAGRYYKQNSDGFAKDRASMRGDWRVVGADLRTATKKVSNHGRQQSNGSKGQ